MKQNKKDNTKIVLEKSNLKSILKITIFFSLVMGISILLRNYLFLGLGDYCYSPLFHKYIILSSLIIGLSTIFILTIFEKNIYKGSFIAIIINIILSCISICLFCTTFIFCN